MVMKEFCYCVNFFEISVIPCVGLCHLPLKPGLRTHYTYFYQHNHLSRSFVITCYRALQFNILTTVESPSSKHHRQVHHRAARGCDMITGPRRISNNSGPLVSAFFIVHFL